MLDMGFINDIRKIVAMLRKQRQTLFFSATMPGEITKLADAMLTDPARVAVTPQATTVERIAQRVILADKAAKPALLIDVLKTETTDRVLVFSRTKHGADKIVRHLQKSGYSAEAIHGNKSQNQRERVLAEFRNGKLRILVATDIAARGIDVDGVSHVVNYDLPNIPESYVHRIGRTARAGADGIAISFCDHEETAYLRDIQRMIRMTIPSTDKRTGVRAESRPAEHHRPGGNGQNRPNRGRQQQRSNGGGNGNGGNGNGGHRNNGGNGHHHHQNRGIQAGNGQNGQAPRAESAQGEPASIGAVPFIKRGNEPRRNNAGHRAPR
jgi:superfamily II DNA/RNA helicase